MCLSKWTCLARFVNCCAQGQKWIAQVVVINYNYPSMFSSMCPSPSCFNIQGCSWKHPETILKLFTESVLKRSSDQHSGIRHRVQWMCLLQLECSQHLIVFFCMLNWQPLLKGARLLWVMHMNVPSTSFMCFILIAWSTKKQEAFETAAISGSVGNEWC